MKQITLILTLMVALISNAQNKDLATLTKEQLKQRVIELQNELNSIDSCNYNHEKYLFCEAINNDTTWSVKSPWDFMEFKVLSAIGDRTSQSVTIELLLTNSSLNQNIYIDAFGATAIDNIGRNGSLLRNGVNVQNGQNFRIIHTDVPTRINLTITSVMPGAEKFNLVSFKMSSRNENDSSYGTEKLLVEIRNIPIEW